jgi:hypothetical protein
MIESSKIAKIKEIWDNYILSDRRILDTRGNELPDIDELRLEAIESLKEIIIQFIDGELSVSEFKTTIDSFNKRNNLWGFTAFACVQDKKQIESGKYN